MKYKYRTRIISEYNLDYDLNAESANNWDMVSITARNGSDNLLVVFRQEINTSSLQSPS